MHSHKLNHEKAINGHTQTVGHFTKSLTSTLANCQGHERQEKTEELHRLNIDWTKMW